MKWRIMSILVLVSVLSLLIATFLLASSKRTATCRSVLPIGVQSINPAFLEGTSKGKEKDTTARKLDSHEVKSLLELLARVPGESVEESVPSAQPIAWQENDLSLDQSGGARLRFRWPDALSLNETGVVYLSIIGADSLVDDLTKRNMRVVLLSDDFSFVPSDTINVSELRDAYPILVRPRYAGKRKIAVVVQREVSVVTGEEKISGRWRTAGVSALGDSDRLLSIDVGNPAVAFGLTDGQLHAIQIVSAAIGVPAISMLALSWLSRRKKEATTSRLIVP